jgi:A/G-specific adenine glycosylase
LKGVGEYTAAALCSYNEVVPVVDGMCFGIVSLFDVETDIVSAKGVCSFGFRIDAKRQSCYFNQAIMEFGALHPSPNCGVCVFNDSCAAAKKKVDQLPVKSKKLKVQSLLIIWLFLTRMKTP